MWPISTAIAVVEYDVPLTTDNTADRVFGQPNFSSDSPSIGGVSAASLDGPTGVALDGWGNLYPADGRNHRVLEYDQPLTTEHTAERVFGQPDFNQHMVNNGGVSANSLILPPERGGGRAGNLYVADASANVYWKMIQALARIYLPLVRR